VWPPETMQNMYLPRVRHPAGASPGDVEHRLGAGLRAFEIISLKVSDIESARMVFRVAQGGWLLLPAKHQLSSKQSFLPRGTEGSNPAP
jgi:hypothetical protein